MTTSINFKNRQLSILKDLIEGTSFQLVNSYIYENSKLPVFFQCENNHTLSRSFNNIVHRGGFPDICPICKLEQTKILALDNIKRQDGFLMSNIESLKKAKDTIKIKCKYGHMWETRLQHIANQHWCPTCSNIKYTVKHLKEILNTRGYELIGELDGGIRLKDDINVRCDRGHMWETTVSSIDEKRTCQKCIFEDNLKYTINDLRQIATRRDGDILESVFTGIDYKHKWFCNICDRSWMATPQSVVNVGSWCPYCNESSGEKVSRKFLESVFRVGFPKVRPKWLRFKNPLELDGYNEELKIAFEHNGTQHYQFNKFFHRDKKGFLNRIKKDKIKREKCKERGVLLLEIPELFRLTELEDLPYVIAEQLEEAGRSIPKKLFEIDLKELW